MCETTMSTATRPSRSPSTTSARHSGRFLIQLGLDAPRKSPIGVITEEVIDVEIARLEAQIAAHPPQRGT
jgi:hypothetical protein